MSVSLFSRRFKTFTSGMSLFAILMLTLAPTISQVLAQREHASLWHGELRTSADDKAAGMVGMAGMSDMGPMPGMSAMSAMSGVADISNMPGKSAPSATSAASAHPHTHTAAPDCSNPPWAACAYCVLLAHLPAIVSSALVSLAVMVIAMRANRVRRFAFPTAYRRMGPQARAPPFHP